MSALAGSVADQLAFERWPEQQQAIARAAVRLELDDEMEQRRGEIEDEAKSDAELNASQDLAGAQEKAEALAVAIRAALYGRPDPITDAIRDLLRAPLLALCSELSIPDVDL